VCDPERGAPAGGADADRDKNYPGQSGFIDELDVETPAGRCILHDIDGTAACA
jgi:hypothetical protein